MSDDGRLRCTIGSVPLVVQPAAAEIGGFRPPQSGERVVELPASTQDRATGVRRFELGIDGWLFEVEVETAARADLRERAARAASEHKVGGDTTLRAQIPGRIGRVWVSVGDRVEAGQRLLAIEAMKMENEIRAPRAGVIKAINVAPGDLVERNGELMTIE